MQDEPLIDGDVNQLFMGCTEAEVAEISISLDGHLELTIMSYKVC
jgi:hypothetical protein